jgi:hypothetical protein
MHRSGGRLSMELVRVSFIDRIIIPYAGGNISEEAAPLHR